MVTLSDEQEREFASWRLEFPRPAAAAVGATEDSSGAGNTEGSPGSGTTLPPLAPGAKVDSEAALQEMGTNFYFKILCPKVVMLLPVR